MSSTAVAEPLQGLRRVPSQARSKGRTWPVRLLLRRPTEVTVTVAVTFLAYIVAAWLLVFRYHSIQGDALSHVNNGALMIYSRDPHMAAVGFVWNPLPSFLAVPFLLLRPWFPWMLSKGFAGNIVSAAAGAAAAGVLLTLFREWGLNRWVRWALVIAFALHPLIFYSGANGMTEALYLLTLLVACRFLARWLRTRSTSDLVACGVALGVGYFVRYEVLAAGLAVGGLVLVTRFVWTGGGFRLRMREAVADFGIVIAPIIFAFVAWALASWIIVGSAFEQFTSQYGNAAQLAVGGGAEGIREASGVGGLNHVLGQLLLLSVALPVGLIVPLAIGLRRRESAVLVPWAVFGSILAFQVLAYQRGQTAGWLRYYIVVVPLVVIAAATLLVDRRPVVATDRTRARVGRVRKTVAALAAVAIGGAGMASSTAMIHNHSLASEESIHLGAVFDRQHADTTSKSSLKYLEVEKQIADYLASLHPARGSVLIDTFYGFAITTQAANLKMFVVTSDRDFKETVADPSTFHVKYIVVPDTVQGVLDAVNVAYPSMYGDGAGIATLLREFKNNQSFADWRVYEVSTTVGG